jgi:uncharacterized RDD family membrane protein YckC
MFFVLPVTPVRADAKASIVNRVIAKMIDFAVFVALAALLPYPLGPLLGFLYSLLADGMTFGPFHSQSIGKKIMKLSVWNRVTKQPASLRESLLRNSPVGVVTFFGLIPLWGWLILAIVGVPLMIMEVYLMATVETGHRLGDVMGDTEVVEYRGGSR